MKCIYKQNSIYKQMHKILSVKSKYYALKREKRTTNKACTLQNRLLLLFF